MEKPSRGLLNIPGTKQSAKNGQLQTSTGIGSVDSILGGGLSVGSITIIEEDTSGSYAKVLLDHFFAEGVINNHLSFIASLDTCPQKMMQSLPSVVHTTHEDERTSSRHGEENMQIAFRYQNLPKQRPNENVLGHYFDLSKVMSSKDLDKSNVCYWNGGESKSNTSGFKNSAYGDLLLSIKDKIYQEKLLLSDSNTPQGILRIGIHSLGSLAWLSSENSLKIREEIRDLVKFFYCLRALLKSSFAVAVVTVPSHLYGENALARCIHSCDIALRLQVFTGTELEKCSSLDRYHGFFHLTKLAPIHSFVTNHLGSIEHVFKLKQKVFIVEKLHLPPDVASNIGASTSKSSCGTSTDLLDF